MIGLAYRLIAFIIVALTSVPAAAQNVATPPPKSESQSNSIAERPSSGTFGTQLAAGELSRIDRRVEEIAQRMAALDQEVAQKLVAEDVRTRLAPLRAQAATVCQSEESAILEFQQVFNNLNNQIEALNNSPVFTGGIEICGEGRQTPVSLVSQLDAEINLLVRRDSAGERSRLESELRQLQVRRGEVIREIRESAAGNQIAELVPWLMLIIFGVGAGSLFGVRFFRDDIQHELVASGQIVQFVTILILLGVILALGLAQRLQAEALGALLGGLAGYVLSQGVGRQERQRVLNEIKGARDDLAGDGGQGAGLASTQKG